MTGTAPADPIRAAAEATYQRVFAHLPTDPHQIARVAQIIAPAWREAMQQPAQQDAAA